MRPEKIAGPLARELEPWQGHTALNDKRSQHAMRIIELARTLAAAETAVLTGNDAKAVADLKRLQEETRAMLATLEVPVDATA